MIGRCRWSLRMLGVAAALVFTACPGPVEEPPTPNEERPTAPQVRLWLARGVLSAVGTVRADTLTFQADRAGAVRVVVGDGCESQALGNGQVAAGQPLTFRLTAEGPLAAEGFHTLSACFTGQDQTQARTAVRLEVDNTAPELSVTPRSGTAVCGAAYAALLCSGCANIAYAFNGQVAFDEQGAVTAGQRYQGFAVPVTDGATLSFKGVDRAGNQTELGQATYQVLAPSITAGAPEPAVVSNNGSSTQRSTDIPLTGVPGAQVVVRRDATSCTTGVAIASTTLDGTGAGSVTVYASTLDSTPHYADPTATVAHPLWLCAAQQGSCSAETTFSVSRKDSSLGYQVDAPVGTTQPFEPWPAEVKLRYLDAAVDATGAAGSVTTWVDGSTSYSLAAPYELRFEADGAVIAYQVPLPENLRVDLRLVPTNLRDEAGNPLPLHSTFVQTAAGDRWHLFGQKAFTAGTGIRTDDRTGLVWEQGLAYTRYWYQAQAYCHARNASAIGGRTDWRLPTVRELVSLLDPNAVASSPAFLPSGFTSGGTRFWTSTAVAGTSNAWLVDFSTGLLVSEYRFNLREVRCVAGPLDGGAPRTFERVSHDGANFVAAPAGPVVRDVASGLLWEQAPDTTPHTYTASLTACDGIRHGATGWVRPTPAHFATLHALLTTAAPVHELSAFQLNATSYYWVSRPIQQGLRPSDAWMTYPSSSPVWCVIP
jgi:hypothetical protein